MKRVVLYGFLGAFAIAGSGCSLAPRSFRDMLHPAPVVRARALGLEQDQPEAVAVPAMIARLSDTDRAVRMAANSELKERTRQDFGFVPWGSAAERLAGVGRWEAWWKDRQGQAAFPKDDQLTRVAHRPGRKDRKRRSTGQGGPTASWPAITEPAPSARVTAAP